MTWIAPSPPPTGLGSKTAPRPNPPLDLSTTSIFGTSRSPAISPKGMPRSLAGSGSSSPASLISMPFPLPYPCPVPPVPGWASAVPLALFGAVVPIPSVFFALPPIPGPVFRRSELIAALPLSTIPMAIPFARPTPPPEPLPRPPFVPGPAPGFSSGTTSPRGLLSSFTDKMEFPPPPPFLGAVCGS